MALHLMTEALDMLDALCAPGEIGSALDLAVARLEKFLGHDDHSATRVQTLTSQLERELAAALAGSGTKPNPWEISPV
jgi:hypothetical protein